MEAVCDIVWKGIFKGVFAVLGRKTCLRSYGFYVHDESEIACREKGSSFPRKRESRYSVLSPRERVGVRVSNEIHGFPLARE